MSLTSHNTLTSHNSHNSHNSHITNIIFSIKIPAFNLPDADQLLIFNSQKLNKVLAVDREDSLGLWQVKYSSIEIKLSNKDIKC